MDSLPGTPQIQNIIPTTFFGTNTWAAPILGALGSIFILVIGLLYLEFRRRQAAAAARATARATRTSPTHPPTSACRTPPSPSCRWSSWA
jgi:H+/gluconate symporter-like permease